MHSKKKIKLFNCKKIINNNKKYIKSILILLVTQSLFYFLIKLLNLDYHDITMSYDSKIPFIKEFIYAYNLWYPFLIISSFHIFKVDIKHYKNFIYTSFIAFLFCDLIFIIYPTIVTRPEIMANDLTSFIVYLTYKYDTPAVNCMPSIHCLFCFNVILYTSSCKNLKKLPKLSIIIFAFLIVISTLLVKQHIIIDTVTSLWIIVIIDIINTKFNIVRKLKTKLDKLLF